MRIGILGGSFNPIHNGHIALANKAYFSLELDEIWIMPSYQTPFKENQIMATELQRLEMCRLATNSIPYIKISDFEINKAGISYTYLTLSELHNKYPEHKFFFIMGADSLFTFSKWKNPDIICNHAELIVMNRDEYNISDLEKQAIYLENQFNASIHIIKCEKIDISSTSIRNRILNNIEVANDLDSDVLKYISDNNLYHS